MLRLQVVVLFCSWRCLFGQVLVNQNNATSEVFVTSPLPTTTPEQTTVVDPAIPAPGRLRKLQATTSSVTLSYEPPPGYRSDPRYTHFLVQFRRERASDWREIEVPKTANPNDLTINGLFSGVLYVVRMSSLFRGGEGNVRLRISPSSPQAAARTIPPTVTDLDVVQPNENLTAVVVTWNWPPRDFPRNEYNKSILSYYIEGLTDVQRASYPMRSVEILRNEALLDSSSSRKENETLTGLVTGAPYRFEMVTQSDGDDRTESMVAPFVLVLVIPGPLIVSSTSESERNISLLWQDIADLQNITGYRLSIERVGFTEIKRNFTTTARNATLSELDPGALYAIRLMALRDNNVFGKQSEETLRFARTLPQKPRNISIISRSETTMTIQFLSPASGEFSHYFITYQTADGMEDSYGLPITELPSSSTSTTVTLSNMLAGALYRINVTIISDTHMPDYKTSSADSVLARTIPPAPQNVTASSVKGTIYLKWEVPRSMYQRAPAHYVINYYAKDSSNASSNQCQIKGQSRPVTTLGGLQPGIGYYITINTVAGETCSGGADITDDVQASPPIGPLLVFTQPNYPAISYWKQVTLNQVRLTWIEPNQYAESFDYYVIDGERIENSDSAANFSPEQFSEEVPKNKTHHLLTLSQGATYRVNVTTAVGKSNERRRSMVVSGVNTVTIKTWHPYEDHFLFPVLKWRFTNCARTGRFGPGQFLCDNEYANTNLNQMVIVENGIQRWIAPIEGLYRIVAVGAGYEGPGGLGATVSGLFYLQEGAGLQISVGQIGKSAGLQMMQGGAGGTFVVVDEGSAQGLVHTSANEVLLAAGGAGSVVFGTPPSNTTSGRLGLDGGNSSNVGVSFGTGGVTQLGRGRPGSGGEQSTGGGAGLYGYADAATIFNAGDRAFPAAGFFPNSESNATEKAKFTPLVGGRYQRGMFSFSEGGFGGGGSGYLTGSGGGGGYSGGGGGAPGGYSGGGGSYIKFSGGQELAEVTNDKSGYVIISVVGLPTTTPIPLTFYLVIAFVAGIAFTFLCGGCLYGVAKCTDKYIDKLDVKNKEAQLAPVTTNDISGPITSGPSAGDVPMTVLRQSKDSEFDTEGSADEDDDANNRTKELSNEPKSSTAFSTEASLADGNLDNDTDSESTASSVSSMATDKAECCVVVDAPTGKLRLRGRKVSRKNSSFSGFMSTDAETSLAADLSDESDDDDDDLPPPPPSPPLTPASPDEVSEEQKRDFRQKLNLFHEMALRSRAPGSALTSGQPTFVPSTNL